MSKHTLWMVIGCTVPLLLIFIAPALGLGSGVSLFIFILAMFACHLFMPMHHHEKHNNQTQD
jgi:uncharacterized membrane protein YesL